MMDRKPDGHRPLASLSDDEVREVMDAEGAVQPSAKRLGCSDSTLRRRLQHMGYEYPHTRLRRADRAKETPDPDFPDLAKFPEEDQVDNAWDALISWQKHNAKWNLRQFEASVHIDTDLPIAVAFRGDWHLGSEGTDHATFVAHRDLILATPGLYSTELGDLQDGFIEVAKMTGVHEAVARPRTQRHFIWDTCKRLKGRIIATAAGQHSTWGVKAADFNPIEWVSADYGIPYLGHGGMLHLKVGKTDYRLHLRHRYRYNSAYNVTHSIKQFWRFDGDSDVGVHADRHTPAIEQCLWKGQVRIACRPGSYKRSDDWAEYHGFPLSEATMPCVVFWPEERKMLPVWGLELAAEILGKLRAV